MPWSLRLGALRCKISAFVKWCFLHCDWTARTWMKGYPVGVSSTSSRLPTQKHSVTSMVNPSAPLVNRVANMIFGIVFDALRTSSDI